VLLYALLCGFLPFDDDNTATLYRLIQEGKYKVPDRLSKESVRLIHGLLQVHLLVVEQMNRQRDWLVDSWIMMSKYTCQLNMSTTHVNYTCQLHMSTTHVTLSGGPEEAAYNPGPPGPLVALPGIRTPRRAVRPA